MNSGPQSFLQAEGLLISTNADIAELSDHRPIWASLHSSRRQRHIRTSQQRGKGQKTPTAANSTNIERQSGGPAIPRHLVREILSNLENMNPAKIIHHLSRLSYDAVQEAQPDKNTE